MKAKALQIMYFTFQLWNYVLLFIMTYKQNEAIDFFLDDLIIQVKGVINTSPKKQDMLSYCDSWLNTLQTIKGLNNE